MIQPSDRNLQAKFHPECTIQRFLYNGINEDINTSTLILLNK